MNERTSDADRRLQQVLVAYVEAADRGEPLERDEVLAQHPEFAAELAEFFADRVRIQQLAEPLRGLAARSLSPAGPDATTAEMTAVGAPAPGATIRYFGDYELLEEIARGGMGVVFKARQVKLKRLVAIKMILAGELANRTDVERFYTEARAAANLHHARIVPIHEVGQHDGQHYFSMDYIAGESLAHRLARGPLPARAAAALMKGVAEAIAFAHVEGVIHRDLKPANILLDAKGEPHITDFGLAKRVEPEPGTTATGVELTHTGQVLGTPSYMPPEQAAGKTKEIGPRSDVYALGAVLYCALTGRPPFQAAGTLDTLVQILERDPVPPRTLNASVPRELETICLKCLDKAPQRRYASAQELADDLGRFLEGRPILARPVGRLARLLKWTRRRPAAAALILVLACAWIPPVVTGMVFVQQTLDAKLEASQNVHAANLATNNANAAYALAEQRRQAAHEAEVAAKLDRADAENANARAKESLKRAEGLRLIYESQTERANNPALALLLAVQGAKHLPGLLANNAMQAAMDECHELRMFQGHRGPVLSASLSADGSRVLTCSEDGTARIWDATTGKQLQVLDAPRVVQAHFSPDGRRVLTLAGHPLFRAPRLIGVGSGRYPADNWPETGPSAQLWDAATGKPIARWQPPAPPGRDYQLLEVAGAAFTADSQLVATFFGMDPGGEAVVHDAESGKQVAVLKGKTPVLALAASPDQGTFATAAVGREVCLWEARTGKRLHVLKGHPCDVGTLAFSADGKRLLTSGTGANHQVTESGISASFTPKDRDDVAGRIWDVATGKQVVALKPDPSEPRFQAARFIHADRFIVLADSHGARVWNAATGEPTSFSALQTGFNSLVRAAISPDGLIVHAGTNRTPQVQVIADRLLLRGHEDLVYTAAFSADGKRLVTASADGTARLWQAPHQGLAASAAADLWWTSANVPDHKRWHDPLSPDGRRLFLSREQPGDGRLIDPVTSAEIARFHAPFSAHPQAVFTPDGKKLLVLRPTTTDAAGQPHRLRAQLVDSATGKVLATMHDLPGRFVALSPDGRLVLVASQGGTKAINDGEDGQVTIWELANGKQVTAFRASGQALESAEFSPDGQLLITRGWGGLTFNRIWQTATGTEPWKHDVGSSGMVSWWTRSFVSDGRQVLSLLPLQLRDAESGKGVVTLTAATLGRGFPDLLRPRNDASLSPDGRRWLTMPFHDVPAVWDLSQGGEPVLVLRGHTGEVIVARFSADGRHIVTGGQDRTARLWDATTGKELLVLKGHTDTVYSVALDAAGERLVTSSGDRMVRLWDAKTGEELVRWRWPDPQAPLVSFTPDSRRVCLRSQHAVQLWPIDVLATARSRLPRAFTAGERERFALEK